MRQPRSAEETYTMSGISIPNSEQRASNRLSQSTDPRLSQSGMVSPVQSQGYGDYMSASVPSVGAPRPSLAGRRSFISAEQTINDVVSSAVPNNAGVTPELIQIISQVVSQQLNQQMTPTTAQPVQPPGRNMPSHPASDYASSFQSSPVLGRASVNTPPSPHFNDIAEANGYSRSATNGSTKLDERRQRGNTSPFSRDSNEEAILSEPESISQRPSAFRRTSSDPNATTLEKHWGKLFNEQGQCTHRLTRFLQGLAFYIIENTEPANSLVVTPEKMQHFYARTALDNYSELYPWHHIFDDKTSSISRLFRDPHIKVEHHLVQDALDARPEKPALTPTGFAAWLTLLIRAHPDQEHERLCKALRIMAIDNPEDQRRYPAEIPRSLFPVRGDEALVAKLAELMSKHCKIQLPRRTNSVSHSAGVGIERVMMNDRAQSPRKADGPPAPTVEDVPDEGDGPLSAWQDPGPSKPIDIRTRGNGTQFDAEATDRSSTPIEDELQPQISQSSVPERTRAPYVAKPGQDRAYDTSGSSDEKATRAENENTLRRTQSVSNSARPRGPSVSLHQRGPQMSAGPPKDLADVARARQLASQDDDMRRRRRSNSQAEPQPYRRDRSKSTYGRERTTRYHPQRSPSYQTQFDARNTAPDVSYTNYPPPERAEREYRSPNYEARLREREKSRERGEYSRQRLSNASDRNYTPDQYRQNSYVSTTQQPGAYPPTAYSREGTR